MYLKDTEKT